MIVVILKNIILVCLIVMIIHFMLKNRLLEENDLFVRRLVHQDVMDQVSNKIEEELRKSDDDMYRKPSTKKRVHFDPNTQDQKEKTSISAGDIIDNVERECPGMVQCKDYVDKPNVVNENDVNMKELYDFVFDEEKRDTDNSLNTYFPTDVVDKTVVDSTEIDQHKLQMTQTTKVSSCDYEVVGLIDELDNIESIQGLDMLSSTNFSNI